jgi:predicted enzyme related to lactoylglutathione lyase
VDILSSRVLLRPVDLERSQAFYGGTLGLAIYREFGEGPQRGVVFFLGGGFLEVSGRSPERAGPNVQLWMQVRDVDATHAELVAKGVDVLRPPKDEPWGLREMWVADPDGVRIALIEVPPDHPLRRR